MPYFSSLCGSKIYYEIIGDGAPVVFLHGWTGDMECFRPAAKALSASRACLLFDQPGHLRSSAPSSPPSLFTLARCLRELTQSLGWKKFSAVGWSMGAATLFAYISLFGCCSLERLILVDMAPRSLCCEGWSIGRFSGGYGIAELDEDLALAERDFSSMLARFLKRSNAGFAALSADRQNNIIDFTLRSGDIASFISLWRSMGEEDFRGILGGISVPTAVFYADPGSVYSPQTGEYLVNSIPGARGVRFYPATHMLVYEKQRDFIREVCDFLT